MIVGVAFQIPSGEVYSLPRPARHCHLVDVYNTMSRERGWKVPWVGYPGRLVRQGEYGFVTEAGGFLSRAAAAQHAWLCGQIDTRKWELFSEDVW